MKSKILGLLAVGLLAGPMAANASLVRVDFAFTISSTSFGFPAPMTFTGLAYFDSAATATFPGTYAWTSFTVDAGGTTLTPAPYPNGSSWSYIQISDNRPTSPPVDSWSMSSSFNQNIGGINIRSVGIGLDGPTTIATGTGLYVPDTSMFTSRIGAIGWSTLSSTSVYSASASLTTLTFTQVPEPGTLALLGLGLAGLGLRRRKAA